MSQIPAPLLNRHTAIAVVVFALLGVAAAVATLVIPIDGSVLWLVVVRQALLAVQIVVVALAVFLIWRTLAGHSFATTIAALAAIGGLLLFALVQLATIVVATPWGVRPVVIALELVALLSAVLMIGGLLALGVSVLRQGGWPGPTRVALDRGGGARDPAHRGAGTSRSAGRSLRGLVVVVPRPRGRPPRAARRARERHPRLPARRGAGLSRGSRVTPCWSSTSGSPRRSTRMPSSRPEP